MTAGTVTIGQHSYPARLTDGGKVERNRKQDGSGEWISTKATFATAPATTRKGKATATAPQATAAKATPTATTGTATPKRTRKGTKATAAKVVSNDLTADLASGNVRLFRVRANGTTRRIPYLAPASTARRKAEQVAALRAAGKTMRQIAEELHESLATVRRELTHLALAQAVEGGADPSTLGYRVERKTEKAS